MIYDKNLINLNAIDIWKANAPDYAVSFIEMKSSVLSTNTLRIYVNNMNIFWKWLEIHGINNSLKDMQSLTNKLCQNFVDEMSSKYATSTVSSIISTLLSLFNFLINSHYAVDNPFMHIKKPKLKKSEPFKFTNDDKCALMHVINTGENMSKRFVAQELSHGTRRRNQAIMKILIETGIKVSKLIALNVNDVNVSDGTLSIKDDQFVRFVNISKDTMSTIKDYIDMRCLFEISLDEKALFLASQGKNKNNRISAETVRELIKKYTTAANIKSADKITANKFRQISLLEEKQL